ncbi:MAG: hypothetical protein A2528_03550 [Candidatus Staskawiczbacteria bacterium RIFOXYD2_FULL_37_9]|uniref:Uncharacterized protein n=1 Tax=Candidatus Staskawiczbacteria bacterium RIFOXYB1_FULL_37_44 TaxID=1802223 RepID=A0A1G2IV30_9BACT|nr:MAG: hypothetical protein A2358_02310 [Candidatus Staskawiczbacteria bacterium RIFOXYB1_FULL_37_44]OGZ82821.1 MAG: hypothetical protein A2416_03290 [Candidatus Staskawiczbacteria bacterium RIFOXYC1_FULL_37_52]OGZ88420.1 MAG: hypothetical protein A2444_03160 [Candidatus Staskawiczbacteria bacterium RIFOXYC2_FULL_37_19]OGZ90592.1 MAG: hypothetical protein A2581_02750 [Candidatus Staskawiczbacteria bacterium RIFOXYD1_FULL_37_110]OGZ93185.1 MAG: hypothetical protein A2528_03550 [Candidatus Stask
MQIRSFVNREGGEVSAVIEALVEGEVLCDVTLGSAQGPESDDFAEAEKAIREHLDAADRDSTTIRVIILKV